MGDKMEKVGFGNLSPVNFEVVSDGNRMEQETAKKMIVKEHLVKNLEDLSHIVTFTVTVAFAIPSQASKDGDFPSDKENTNQKKPKKIIDPTKPRGYYHFEYFLLPEDTGPTKVDVVMFGHMAKLYLESESKIIKPWTENEKIWLLWSHDVDLPVTKNFIQKSSKHKVQVKIWDTKEKVSSKARFDKPRTFKVRKGDYSEDEIRDLILSQIKHFDENQPRPSSVRHQNENRSRSWQDVTRSEMDRSQKLSSVSAHIPASTNPYLPNQVTGPLNAERFFPMMNTLNEMSASHTDFLDAEADLEKFKMKTRKYSVERKTDAMLKGNKNKKEICMKMKLNFVHFVAGELSVTNRLKKTSNKILDCYMTLAINKPLLSEEQKRELNPLVIRILSTTSLPASPTPISLLQEKCSPVFCKYKFHNQPVHKTHGQDHGTHVYFKDINVILAGTISPGQLREFLHGPPIEIEVHDRDRKIEKSIIKPSLFGTEPEDEKFSNVGLVTSKRTVHNPFTKKDKMWNPYGVAKVSLSDLLHDTSYLNISAPIHSCEAPDVSGYNADHKTGKIVGIPGSVDGPEDAPLPVGHYLDAQSLLKVRVDIAVPLSLELESSDCPYGRVIYIFDYTNKILVYNILQKITKINAKALNLDVYPVDILQDVLSKISLKDFKKDDPPMDVITGVHVMDGAIHVFILEGLKDKAIKNLWESLPTKTTAENGILKVLYNSGLSFSERLYKDLSSMVYHIRLHKHFSSIIKQPLLYIRDMVPSPCFQALSRLDYICHAKRLRDVIQGDLFPTEKMMSLLSQEFGVPVTLTNLLIEKKEILRKPLHIDKPSKKRVLHSPIETFNEEYMQWKESENKTSKDYIQKNMDGIHEMSKSIEKLKDEYIQIYSSELAKKILGKGMEEDPKSRFTYWQDNLRTTAGPMDKSKWITSNEFRYPGFKSSSESNEHPKKPDEARKMDLSKAWRENVLHANTLQPTLRRDRWSWTQRNIDFDLYRKPPRTFSAPVTIHHAGDTLQNIQKQAAEVEKQKWLQNIQVDDINMRFYRRLPETELIDKGPKASDQQSKLTGLLKDPPLKFSLRREGLSLKPIPSLSVIDNSGDNAGISSKNTINAFVPGEQEKHSLKWDGNAIPCHNREHSKFEGLKEKSFALHSSEQTHIFKKEIKPIGCEEEKTFDFMKQSKVGKKELPALKFHSSHSLPFLPALVPIDVR